MAARDDIAARLGAALQGRAGLVSAYLFGSAVTGRMHRESDVDIGLLLDRGVHATPRRDSTCGCGSPPSSGPQQAATSTS